jgi:hypothetical protein
MREPVLSPAELGIGADPRKLALALLKLRLDAAGTGK